MPKEGECGLQPLSGGGAILCFLLHLNCNTFFHFSRFHSHTNTLFLMQQCSTTWARQEKWHTIKVTDAVFPSLSSRIGADQNEIKKIKNTRECDAIHTSFYLITHNKKIRNETIVIILSVCSKLNAVPRWRVLFSFMFFLMRILSFQHCDGRFTTVTLSSVSPWSVGTWSQEKVFNLSTSSDSGNKLTIFVPLKCYVIAMPTQVRAEM